MQAVKYVVVIAAAASALLPPPQSSLNKGCALMPVLGASQKFFQITEEESITQRGIEERAAVRYPAAANHFQSVKSLITQLDPVSLHTIIEDFSDFQNRFFNGSEYSMKASRWLYTKINQTVTASNATGVVVEAFDHAGWDQPSIIVSIPGISAKTIVVGAHQDSITRPCYQVPRDYAPGAGMYNKFVAMSVMH
jgi:leucyl aminopeptidase